MQRAGPFGFAGGVQVGYNWQNGRWLAGIEGDVSYLHLNFDPKIGVPFVNNNNTAVINSYNNANWVSTVRPRVGWAANDWLIYATGGPALTRYDDRFSVNVVSPFGATNFFQSSALEKIRLGYAVGGGVEHAIDNNFSLRAEYLHLGFGRATAMLLQSSTPTQIVTQSADLRADIIRFGLNYRFGHDGDGIYDDVRVRPVRAPVASIWDKSNWEFEVGTRAFFSTGVDAESNPLGDPSALESRLLWSKLDSLAGETYARVDHSSGWFVKGFMGAGGIFNSILHDEDYEVNGPGTAYSNTYLTATGSMGYLVADVGYTFLRAPGAKLGAFVGYGFFSETLNSHGCTQVAGADICRPPDPPNTLELSNEDHYNSLRVGLSSEFMLTDKLKFVADAAYTPLVNLAGVDDHNSRGLIFPSSSSAGYGTMIDAFFTYDVTNNWNVGFGGRYWAWVMRKDGTSLSFGETPILGSPDAQTNQYMANRYGFYVQSGYHWGDTTRPAGLYDTVADATRPMDWTGVYVGGHIGGGWSTAYWTDPFGRGLSAGGDPLLPGFNDNTKAHGPLGGVQASANWQTGRWVVGIAADVSGATMRGDNTCFSGMGGVNCEHVINAFSTLTGRFGVAWDRAMFYVKAGGAIVNAGYNLNGNTGSLNLGMAGVRLNSTGWTGGLGLEYAITDHWTTSFEYNHIDLANASPAYPTIPIINAQRMNVSQSLDTLELGVNYKIDWPARYVASN
jgi:opacity protein-like surface antigen